MNLRDLVNQTLTIGEYTELSGQIDQAVQNGLVTFDTNVLLDLYLLDAADLNSLFNSLQGSLRERLWLTHQVASEYRHLRDTRARNRQKKLKKLLEDQQNLLKELPDKLLQPLKNEKILVDETTFPDWHSALQSWLAPYNQEIVQEITYFSQFSDPEHDPILDQLNRLFEERITPELSTADLTNFLNDGQMRYTFKIPPGYADQIEKQKKFPDQPQLPYGDLLLWEQLIRLANSSDLPSVLLISRETKVDWTEWRNFEDEPGLLIIRRDLQREFKERTGKNISMLNLEDFLHTAQRLRVLQPVPAGNLGQLLRSILQQDLQRLTDIRELVLADLARQQRYVQSTSVSLEALDTRWMEQDQFEAPDANQAFIQYNRMRETLQHTLHNVIEAASTTRFTLERIDEQMRQVQQQLHC